MRRSLMLIPVAFTLCALPALATFDGTYSGNIIPVPGAASANCVGAPITATVDEGGRISSASLDGFVNVKAFVTGSMKTSDGRKLPIEGRVEDQSDNQTHLSAGAIDDRSGCAWTIDLVKQAAR